MFDSHQSCDSINEAFRAEICLNAVLLHCCWSVKMRSNSVSIFFLIYLLLHFISMPVHPHDAMAINVVWLCTLPFIKPARSQQHRLEKHSFIPNKIRSPFLTAFLIPSSRCKMNRKHFVASHFEGLRHICLLLQVSCSALLDYIWTHGPNSSNNFGFGARERNKPKKKKKTSLWTFKNL